jgi:hypothetical protein
MAMPPPTAADGVPAGLPVPTAGEDDADDTLGPPVCRGGILGRVSLPGC